MKSETKGWRPSREEGPFPKIDFRDEKWMNQKFKVYCIDAEEPNKCWLQLTPDNTNLVQYKVSDYEKSLSKAMKEVDWDRKVGDPCLAVYQKEYYRAEIIGDLKDGRMKVRYVDYGNQERVKLNKIMKIPKDLIEDPEGATLCILNDFLELEEAVDRFEDMAEQNWMCEINWPSYKAPDGKCYPLVSLFEEKEGSPFSARFGIPRLPVSEEIKKANPFVRFGPTEYQTQDENATSSATEPKEQENKVVEKREVTPVKAEVQVQPPAPEKAKQPLAESFSMNTEAPPTGEVDGGDGVAGDQKRRKLSTLAEVEVAPGINLEAKKGAGDAVDGGLAVEAPIEIPKVAEVVKEEVLPVEKVIEEPESSKVVEKPKLHFNTKFAKLAEKRKYSSEDMFKMQAQAEVSKVMLPKEVVQTPPPPPPALTKEMMTVTQVEALTQPQAPVFYLVEKTALDNVMKKKEAYKKRLQAALDKFNGTLGEMSEDLAQMNEMARDLKLMD